jgi:hypothetical protein
MCAYVHKQNIKIHDLVCREKCVFISSHVDNADKQRLSQHEYIT